jgi:hypothetical protein
MKHAQRNIRGRFSGGVTGVAWCAAAVLVLSACLFGGGIDTSSGAVIDEPYTVSGRVHTASGAPARGARVTLVPSGYDAAAPRAWRVRTVVTDSLGLFVFAEDRVDSLFASTAARTARYALHARSADGLTRVLVDSLVPRRGTRTDTLRLSPPRRLVVSLTPADSVAGVRFPATLSVPGTSLLVSLDGAGPAVLDSLPVGARRVVLRFITQSPLSVALPGIAAGSDPVADILDTLRLRALPDGRVGF